VDADHECATRAQRADQLAEYRTLALGREVRKGRVAAQHEVERAGRRAAAKIVAADGYEAPVLGP
jgi:hypothetical protein